MWMTSSEASVEPNAKTANGPVSEGGSPACQHELPITVYTSESPLRRPVKLFGDMTRDLVASPRASPGGSSSGTPGRNIATACSAIFGVLIPPLIASLPFIFLNAQGVIRIAETPLPYGAYAMLGTTIWQVFTDALNSPLRAISGALSILELASEFPREALLLSGLMQVGLELLSAASAPLWGSSRGTASFRP